MGIGRLRVIDSGWTRSGVSPARATMAATCSRIGRRLVVSHERNSETNDRLEAAGCASSGSLAAS